MKSDICVTLICITTALSDQYGKWFLLSRSTRQSAFWIQGKSAGHLRCHGRKDNATCLTLSRCAAQFNNILEDIYIEARMCEEYPGTFKQGIQINNLRMSELIPSIQEQIDCGYQPFSIMSNLILSYCRTGNINNRTNYSGEYTDTLSDCMDYIDDALIATQGKERLRASNYLLVLCWNYIQPMVELTRESLKSRIVPKLAMLWRICCGKNQVADLLFQLVKRRNP